ncbi:MAG TPA: DUF4340 domain-containing protein [Candidatus Limnocylindrales bacterium]|nr:DUF4340 domain-containing protein [Candidatus Limnocylindrales bacterium]
MSWLRIVVYFALAAALTLHLNGVAAEREAATAATVKQTTPFLEAVPERIDRVRIEKDGLAVQFERKDGKWIVTEPEGLAPPGDVIDAVLESFTSLPPIEIVSEGVEHEGQFGFVPPRARIRIEQQGALVSTIILGELNPTRTSVYAKRSGKDEVALIGLNAKYYIDLVFENVERQRGSGGALTPQAGDVPAATGADVPAPSRAASPAGSRAVEDQRRNGAVDAPVPPPVAAPGAAAK